MSSDILMPQLGETVAEGKVLGWFKAEGDEVREGDNLFEIETDKVTMEVQSTVSGRLTNIRVKTGEVARVGSVVAVIGGGEVAEAPPSSAPAEATGTAIQTVRRPLFEEVSTPVESFGDASGPQGVRITPLARRLIVQNGLDVAEIARTVSAAGRSRIAQKDVQAALAAPRGRPSADPATALSLARPAASPASAHAGNLFQLNTIRRRTGERLQRNWQTIPHVFQAIEVDFTSVEAVRTGRREGFRAQTGFPLTYLPFIARAACIALKEFPQANAQFMGDALALAPQVNLGIAVDLGHDGLVVPVVHNADDLTLPGLAKAIGRQIERARAGKLTGDDFAGGTYSISNNGVFGTSFTAPIINAPQVAILSTDAIRLRPAVVETPQGAFVAPRLTGMVGQSFDHRAFDGAYSAAFLSRLKAVLETRDWAGEFA